MQGFKYHAVKKFRAILFGMIGVLVINYKSALCQTIAMWVTIKLTLLAVIVFDVP